ncbi:MAG: OmpA family protein [Rhodospirillales bacterium]|nr:OmpA family protein [Alphaproteobacteria bacterium]MBL6947922.1 OmpA family protein [Rhodospirillales bacterium]
MTSISGNLPSVRCLLWALIFVFASLVFAPKSGLAQSSVQAPDLSTDEVTVDLSVIGAPGAAPYPTPYLSSPRGIATRRGLLLPGKKTPVSQLHVPAPKSAARIKLKKPGRKPRKTAKRAIKKTSTKRAMIKKPTAPTVSASKPPAPLSATPPAAPVVAPAPQPTVAAPEVKKQETAKKTAPKPAPASEMKPEPKAAPKLPAPAEQKTVQKIAKETTKGITKPEAEKPVVKMPLPPKAAPPPAPVTAPSPAPSAPPAMKAEAKPEAAPIETKAKKEQATLPPATGAAKSDQAVRVEFGATASKLPAGAKKGLQALATKMKGKDNLRLQLMAYAGGKSLSSSKARRMSLSRALSVRSFLIENGVRSTRIDVRALGSKTTEKPLNRVDVNIVER